MTDDYALIASSGTTEPVNSGRPHLSGWVEFNKDGNLTTVSNFQMENIGFDEPVHTISRTVKIVKQP